MSAMSNLAGLYPPQKGQIWNPDLLWQPIPVHTVPVDDDNIIGNHAKCPKYEKLLGNIENLPELQKVKAENDWVFKYLTENTGSNVTSLWDIDYLTDCLYIESVYNKTLPEWTKKVFPDHMKPMQDLSFKLSTYTEEMKRLRGGPIIQSILDHFHNFIAKNHERKMLMYSGHDTTLSALLNSLGMFDPPIGKADLFVPKTGKIIGISQLHLINLPKISWAEIVFHEVEHWLSTKKNAEISLCLTPKINIE